MKYDVKNYRQKMRVGTVCSNIGPFRRKREREREKKKRNIKRIK